VSRLSKDHLTTPYGRVHQTLFTILPYSLSETTLTLFDICRDGQAASYSKDGVIWQNINFQLWSNLVDEIMRRMEEGISKQLPSGMAISDLLDRPIVDDFSKASPHLQEQNRVWMEERAGHFRSAMFSTTERRHKLFNNGKLDTAQVHKYITHDQEIRGLASSLLAVSSAVTMRAFQFPSIVFNSCDGFDRNLWIVNNRFVPGKPKAKQRSTAFADTLFWYPRKATQPLAVLLFYQQPFICSLLQMLGTEPQLYASHMWPLAPSEAGPNPHSLVWSGQQINRSLKDISLNIIGSPVDPALIRQMAEGLLRDKVPALFEVYQSRDNIHLEKGSYRFSQCLEAYANLYGLQAVANAAKIVTERAAACLIVVDIWQYMHKIEPRSLIWQPMVANSYLFPTTAHDGLAWLDAHNLKQTAWIVSGHLIDEDTLTAGLKLLADSNFPEFVVRVFVN
jgi:hypothetical protein